MIDKERAKTDFGYFASHCLVDTATGKPIQFTQAQIKQIQKLKEFKGENVIHLKPRN